MSQHSTRDELVQLRRDLHRHPEPAWCEFYTTARLIEALRARDVDEIHYGAELYANNRRNVPDDRTLTDWYERALEAGADEAILADLQGGYTGAVAVISRGEGPTVGLRVDIDALPITEATDTDHVPAREGFRSQNEGHMHACGHDAHATIGLGVLDRLLGSGFTGTLKLFFQPGEEQIVGAEPMADSGLLDDVDYFLAVHVGLDHPTGEVVAGVDGFLAVSHFRAEFQGTSAHAGGHPEQGDNAVQAMATAIQNLYGIPRHHDGATRVNAGLVGGGTATNIIPEEAYIEGEVRGETTALMEYMDERVDEVIDAAASMHDCDRSITRLGRAPSAESDDTLVDIVSTVARETEGVETVLRRDDLGGSEDATIMMRRVQDHGGVAAYVGVGTDHPGGHHTSTFDVDERSIDIGIATLAETLLTVSREDPSAD